ncbi:hypothetical protein CRG98_024124 [Punica granatum]|uniref:non-specific serine/threonine protein kinase n=1 Tax=Punica granatum TaxID=22663 RepID=A0A2I0JGY7_PUNGR|nr:hypothetical protein CRG98_024124 [Punica granatum]
MESGVVVVAVDTSKEITGRVLEWAARNAIKPSDALFLLAVLPSRKHLEGTNRNHHQPRTSQFFSSLLKKWGLRHIEKNPSSGIKGLIDGAEQDRVNKVKSACELMMQQLFLSHNLQKVHGEVRVLADAQIGSVASMAGELGATWVILDRHLKKEGDCCLKQLICNIVVIDHSIPRIMRSVNPATSTKLDTFVKCSDHAASDILGLVPVSSHRSSETGSTATQSSLGIESPDFKSSPSRTNATRNSSYIHLNSRYFSHGNSRKDMKKGSNLAALYALPAPARRSIDSSNLLRSMTLISNPSNGIIPREDYPGSLNSGAPKVPALMDIGRTSSIRRAMDLSIKHPPTPPLCSICKHKAPHFGKAPRKFSHEEIETATNGFAFENFLAEGGCSSVYRGVLHDGQVIAVKQPKFLSAQTASEFCSEVEVLSCAQHKNLVMLVGYCIEIEWLLVYEFVCNGSLDKHLYGKDIEEVMAWHNRMKVARGAARGLRYLHEDCRVGCIIHRDFRPNNILLTHDFEPMVGDFGLARWQADGQLAEETRVLGSFGYLAPEYTQSGLITEKADVYAYGVVLLELLSGYKATEFSRNTGKQFVPEWGLPLLREGVIEELIDRRLVNEYVNKEVKSMIHVAELCLLPVPEQRPRMSQVLKILDGDMPSNMVHGYEQQQSFPYANEKMGRNTSSHLTQLMSSTIRSPALTSERRKSSEEIIANSTFVSNGYREEADSCHALKQSENVVSEEYQAYLQGSLAKFIQNMNVD